MQPASTEYAAMAERTRRRVTRRLMPFLFLLYIVAFLDRVNIGYAGLEMTKELGFSDTVFGLGTGIFFIGYVLLEIPGTVLVELWSARKWICRIMVTWGLIAALTGLIHSAPQFYGARFLLGVAEAGFFPGVIVYLTHWYCAADRAKAIAMFMSAIPVSQILGSPISAALLKIHWLGLAGWRWLLILEGVPAVVLGIVTLFYLTDRPQDAKWMPAEEREWLAAELDRERAAMLAKSHVSAWKAFFHPAVLLLTVIYFAGANVSYGLSLWLPKMVQKLSGFNPLAVTLLSAVPYLATWPFMLWMGWHSDRTNERRWHVAVCFVIAGAGLALTRMTDQIWIGLLGFTLASMGINGRLPPFWALPSSFLTGTSAAAVVGAINCVGNTGGFVGPSVVGFLTQKTGTYRAGVLYLIGSAVVGAVLVVLAPRARNEGSSGA